MKVLHRKLLRELLAARGVLIAIISIIAVGIGCFIAMFSTYDNLEYSRQNYYRLCHMADFSIELKKVPLGDLEAIAQTPGVTNVLPRIVFEVTASLEDVEKPLSGKAVSLPEHENAPINSIVIKQGSYFTDQRQEEVIVNDAFARAHNLRPGDHIQLILNNRLQDLLIVGTAISSEFVYLIGPGGLVPEPESYGVFYLKHDYAEDVFGFEGAANQILGHLAPQYQSPNRVRQILDQLELELEDYGVFSTTPLSQQSSHWFLKNEIDGLKISATILPTIFLIVAALALNLLMSRMAEQQRTVVGTLKALGYSNQEMFRHFIQFGLLIGVAGGILGTLLGYSLAGAMTAQYRNFFEFPSLTNQIYPRVILLGMLISVFFAVLGTFRGVRTVVRLSPAEAMRPKPPLRARRILLERIHVFWQALDFRWQMVLRDIFRNRTRTIGGLLSATVGAMLLLVTFSMYDSAFALLNFQYDKLLLSDIDLTFKDDHDYSAYFEAQQIQGVDYAEPLFQVGCTLQNGIHEKKTGITGILRDARLTIPRDTEGNRVEVPPTGLLVTRKLADILHIQAGDSIRMVPVSGDRIPRQVPVMKIIDSYLGLTVYADFHYLNRLMGEADSLTSVQLKTNPRPEVTRKIYRQLKQVPAIQTVNSIRDQKDKLQEVLVDQMIVMIVVVIVFSCLIFFGSILNASLISLSERQQEIATLRVLGYTPGEVGTIFLRESFSVNLPGILLGLPAGYWASKGINIAYDTELFRMPFTIYMLSWVMTVVLGILFTLISHWPVQKTIQKMDWLQALNVKE
ncbi:outer membrane-specific lipoprotein transporter subunit LolE [Gimesia chilikensis]|uniref:Outer membrane-specific lipoprotein transporter subunit LolE n=1 Tax=Gimesia chilikensis TaxID=2605989 RepID=A0A517WLP0_9PLAN|nr:FtsX-like permease family protein [Gimesia chilikensis]QDU06176.1 outer membrane-specific lipoprotein transporter subunit LolE [Gimesia chilikensis]